MALINNIIALDVGSSRIGVAIASVMARMPRPLITLANSDTFFQELHTLIEKEDAQVIVVGMPRGLDGQRTEQTIYTENFIQELKSHLKLPVYTQDEAVTSRKAEEELTKRGKPYTKEDIDSLAATYILDDFLQEKANLLH
ncbi:MAG: Holliday junction resolvase RuvX [bacterium]